MDDIVSINYPCPCVAVEGVHAQIYIRCNEKIVTFPIHSQRAGLDIFWQLWVAQKITVDQYTQLVAYLSTTELTI